MSINETVKQRRADASNALRIASDNRVNFNPKELIVGARALHIAT